MVLRTLRVAPEPLTALGKDALLTGGERSLSTAGPARRTCRRPGTRHGVRSAGIHPCRTVPRGIARVRVLRMRERSFGRLVVGPDLRALGAPRIAGVGEANPYRGRDRRPATRRLHLHLHLRLRPTRGARPRRHHCSDVQPDPGAIRASRARPRPKPTREGRIRSAPMPAAAPTRRPGIVPGSTQGRGAHRNRRRQHPHPHLYPHPHPHLYPHPHAHPRTRRTAP